MSTHALDVTTILHAISVLDKELNTTEWNANNQQQLQMIAWMEDCKHKIAAITGLEAKASRFWEELNSYLVEHGFNPVVQPFSPTDSIGVVSILDKLVHWLNGPGEIVDIHTVDGMKPGFELPPSGTNVYEVPDYPESYLVELLTKTNETLWLFLHDNIDIEGIGLVKLSMDVMAMPRDIVKRQRNFGTGSYNAFAGVQVPMVDFDVQPDISWLCGMNTTTQGGVYYFISQAMQQFKMRMDETGARVKVATVIVATRGISEGPKVLKIDSPFYGWWTQGGIALPMAAFFVDYDTMVRPAGSLEDL